MNEIVQTLKLDTGILTSEWRAKSKAGEFCGIFGCFNKPNIHCKHCGNYYCSEHEWVIGTPAHKEDRVRIRIKEA